MEKSAAKKIPEEIFRKIEIMAYQLSPHPCATVIKDYAKDTFMSGYIDAAINSRYSNDMWISEWREREGEWAIDELLAKGELVYKDYEDGKITNEYIEDTIGFYTWDVMVVENECCLPHHRDVLDVYNMGRTDYTQWKEFS